MDLYKVTVALDGRDLGVVIKPGILATVEVGKHENKVERPSYKLGLIVGRGRSGMAAWVQVTEYDRSKSGRVIHEGWVTEKDGRLSNLVEGPSIAANLSPITDLTPEVIKCQEDADFGTLACCTAYGNGCYVRCCNCCCSDPVGCPGASCCG